MICRRGWGMHRHVVIVFLLPAAVVAQTNRGGITGAVTDASGAVVPGASITVTSIGTNQTRHAAASASGVFTVADLEPLEYRVDVTAPGFKRAIVDHVKVDTASVAAVNVKLEA